MRYMELSRTAYVILGMIQLGKRTGYEIKGLVDISTRFFWAASYGQIYPELARLEELGLVRGERDPEDARRRKSYELTDEGRRALRDWLTSGEPLHLELRHEGMLKLFFSDVLSPEEQRERLREMRAAHAQVAAQLRSIEPEVRAAREERDRQCPYRVLQLGIEYEDFLVDWCERAERELAGHEATA
jgi:PadR family transcriptional regulator, regulatory protein AphA